MPIRSKISLSLAMALSGLEREEWADFKELYDEGAKMAKSVSCSSSSSTASQRTSPSITSTESGIASISPDFNTPSPLSDEDFSLLKLDVLQIDGGKKILKFLDSLDEKQELQLTTEEEEKMEDTCVCTSEIIWTDRNLLDLYDNVIKNKSTFMPAVIPKGVDSYFKHRSQISRLHGATVPQHKIHLCAEDNCKFVEYIF